ncbi:MAG: hypothetical protein ACOCVA_07745, partial [Prolixibacteraceae bacterium]
MVKDSLNKFSWIRRYRFYAILLVSFCFLSELVIAQIDKKTERWFSEARQQFTLQSYKQAKDICYEILERDSNFVDAHLLLADIYHATDSLRQEIKQLEKAKKKVEMDHVYYRLGNAYYLTGNYQNALANFEQYLNATETSSGRTSEISRKVENCRFAIEAKKNPVDFQPERLSDNVNTDNDEYWPNLSIDQQELVFTRLIKRPGYFPQEDFYISELDSAGWGVARPIVEINTPENEGAQIISADGRIMFFTACNRPGGKG